MKIATSVELGPGYEVCGAQSIQEFALGDPLAFAHKLVLHHGDVRCRSAKRDGAKLPEHECDLCERDLALLGWFAQDNAPSSAGSISSQGAPVCTQRCVRHK